MADFPVYQENTPIPHQEVTITPPAFDANDSREAGERFVDQQWRDAARDGLGKTHPLALNRDSSFVTNDPYTP